MSETVDGLADQKKAGQTGRWHGDSRHAPPLPLHDGAPLQAFGQLAEGFGLDLANTLARQAQRLADFLQRPRLVVVQAEPHPQDGRFAGVHRFQHAACTWTRLSLVDHLVLGALEPRSSITISPSDQPASA